MHSTTARPVTLPRPALSRADDILGRHRADPAQHLRDAEGPPRRNPPAQAPRHNGRNPDAQDTPVGAA
jgi:hypothetical protein